MTGRGIDTQVRDRKEVFATRSRTRIWGEKPSPANPYLADAAICHGYDHLDLIRHCGFADVLYLLFRGELPSQDQSALLDSLMVALINPGPRHPACRAVMNTAVSKTNPAHFLPIGLSLLSGDHLGNGEVAAAMKFLLENSGGDPEAVAGDLLELAPSPEGDRRIAPGFGTRFGGIDPMAGKIVRHFSVLPGAGDALRWGARFVEAIEGHGMGWLMPGIAAAVFIDLGFSPREGGGLFQMMSAPGILAHGLELVGQPLTAMPFVENKDYVIERG
ncbi:MAG: citrate synthase [Nitrospirota bacterium]|nr:citrate synthase [Nitrospirota bacterium]